MTQSPNTLRSLGFLLVLTLLVPQTPEVMSADLTPKTLEAFGRYVEATEAHIKKELARP